MSSSASIDVQSIALTNNQCLKVVSLVNEKALNALTLEMAQRMLSHLKQWKRDSGVAAIVLCGQGEKAFCAGGDVVTLYRNLVKSGLANDNRNTAFCEQFFRVEYELDLLIHRYPKPIIAFGDGYILGGGLGLFAGASHKVVTPRSALAMPEITIGLYPDVGASYFLSRLPSGVGLFLGLTASHLSAKEAIDVGFAHYLLPIDSLGQLLDTLTKQSHKAALSPQMIDGVLTTLCTKVKKPNADDKKSNNQSLAAEFVDFFEQLDNAPSLENAVFVLENESPDLPWFQKAVANFRAGSPLSAHIVFEQLIRGKQLNIEQCFDMELSISKRCTEVGDFVEGVRALLIDKDKKPNWRYKTISSVPNHIVNSFFPHD